MVRSTLLNIPGKFAIVLDNVFTKEECRDLIKLAEKHDFTATPEKIETRNSSRWMTDDPMLTDKFFQRIKKYLPPKWNGRPLSCLNERLRFLKYTKGQYFKPHYDGQFERHDYSECSFVTVQIYLNGDGDLKGGATTFFPPGSNRLSVQPAPGKVIIFEHKILHEGSKILDGVKYVIRTDVMYKRRNN